MPGAKILRKCLILQTPGSCLRIPTASSYIDRSAPNGTNLLELAPSGVIYLILQITTWVINMLNMGILSALHILNNNLKGDWQTYNTIGTFVNFIHVSCIQWNLQIKTTDGLGQSGLHSEVVLILKHYKAWVSSFWSFSGHLLVVLILVWSFFWCALSVGFHCSKTEVQQHFCILDLVVTA